MFEHGAAAIACAQILDRQHRFGGVMRRDLGQGRRRRGRGPLGAEIGGDNLGIGSDLGRLAVRDQTPLVEHADPIGQCEHAVDVVLDEQHRVGLGEPRGPRQTRLPGARPASAKQPRSGKPGPRVPR